MKTCTKCKAEKPLPEFNKQSASKDGLSSICKSCQAAYKAANRERISAKNAALYVASREKKKAQSAAYYAANREKYSAYQAAYQSANREKLTAYNSSWRSANFEKISARLAAYHAANPDKRTAHGRNSRARRRSAEGRHTALDITRIFEHQRGLCANCHSKLFKSGKQKFHVDHIVPLVKGGSNWPSNLQCLCPTCNMRKNAKDPIAWANEQGRLL